MNTQRNCTFFPITKVLNHNRPQGPILDSLTSALHTLGWWTTLTLIITFFSLRCWWWIVHHNDRVQPLRSLFSKGKVFGFSVGARKCPRLNFFLAADSKPVYKKTSWVGKDELYQLYLCSLWIWVQLGCKENTTRGTSGPFITEALKALKAKEQWGLRMGKKKTCSRFTRHTNKLFTLLSFLMAQNTIRIMWQWPVCFPGATAPSSVPICTWLQNNNRSFKATPDYAQRQTARNLRLLLPSLPLSLSAVQVLKMGGVALQS